MDSPKLKESIASKKLWFSVFAVASAFLFALLAAERYPVMVAMFAPFLGFLEVISGLYLTGNLVNKWVLSRNKPKKPKPAAP